MNALNGFYFKLIEQVSLLFIVLKTGLVLLLYQVLNKNNVKFNFFLGNRNSKTLIAKENKYFNYLTKLQCF